MLVRVSAGAGALVSVRQLVSTSDADMCHLHHFNLPTDFLLFVDVPDSVQSLESTLAWHIDMVSLCQLPKLLLYGSKVKSSPSC